MKNINTSAAKADYQRAGFGGRLGWGEAGALLVVDMMRAYFDKGSPMYAGVENVLASNCRILKVARAARIPIVFTRQEYSDHISATYAKKVRALDLLRPGSPLNTIVSELGVRSDERTVLKYYPSAFWETDLSRYFAQRGVDTVIITGLTTSGCIRATAMDALIRGFVPIIVEEGVGDRNRDQHEANLFDIDAKLGDVCGEKEVISWLARQAATS